MSALPWPGRGIRGNARRKGFCPPRASLQGGKRLPPLVDQPLGAAARRREVRRIANGVVRGAVEEFDLFGGVRLLEHRAEHGHQTDVESVDPDRIPVGFVDMVVPAPVRLNDEVAPLHDAFLAVGDGVGILPPFENETHGRRGVPMGVDRFAGLDQLHRHDQRIARPSRGIRVDQRDGSSGPLEIRRHEPCGRIQPLPDLRPLPELGRAKGSRLHNVSVFADPQPLHRLAFEQVVQRLQVGYPSGVRHSISPEIGPGPVTSTAASPLCGRGSGNP